MGAFKYPLFLLISISYAINFVYAEDINDVFFNEKFNTSYKLMYMALPWDDAKKSCETEGFVLAVPKTKEEFDFIQKVIRSMNYTRVKSSSSSYKLLAWIGVNNRDNYQIWKNIHGENIQDAEFHTWAEGNGITFSADPKEPHCAGIDAHNSGLRDYWCHHSQPYVCEKQIIN